MNHKIIGALHKIAATSSDTPPPEEAGEVIPNVTKMLQYRDTAAPTPRTKIHDPIWDKLSQPFTGVPQGIRVPASDYLPLKEPPKFLGMEYADRATMPTAVSDFVWQNIRYKYRVPGSRPLRFIGQRPQRAYVFRVGTREDLIRHDLYNKSKTPAENNALYEQFLRDRQRARADLNAYSQTGKTSYDLVSEGALNPTDLEKFFAETDTYELPLTLDQKRGHHIGRGRGKDEPYIYRYYPDVDYPLIFSSEREPTSIGGLGKPWTIPMLTLHDKRHWLGYPVQYTPPNAADRVKTYESTIFPQLPKLGLKIPPKGLRGHRSEDPRDLGYGFLSLPELQRGMSGLKAHMVRNFGKLPRTKNGKYDDVIPQLIETLGNNVPLDSAAQDRENFYGRVRHIENTYRQYLKDVQEGKRQRDPEMDRVYKMLNMILQGAHRRMSTPGAIPGWAAPYADKGIPS